MLLTLALALTLSKDPVTVDLFMDKGDMFIKAGTKSGVKVGDEVTVLDGDREGGSATVMEVLGASLARVKLDAEAVKHSNAKRVRLGGKASGDPASTEPVTPPGGLPGSATIIGIGPAKQITLYNKGDVRWTNCDLRLPDNRHYALAELRGKDQERIFLHMFRQDGVELDRPLDTLSVKCDQGASRFQFEL